MSFKTIRFVKCLAIALLCGTLAGRSTSFAGNPFAMGATNSDNDADKKKEGPDVGQVTLDSKGLPSKADLLKAGPLGDIALGAPNAPNLMIEYISLTCPYCRAFHQKTFPALKKRYIDTGKLRYIARSFPIGRSSGTAAIIARCDKGRHYYKLVDAFLNNQPIWVSQTVRPDAIFKVAQKVGMTRSTFNKCLRDKKLETSLRWVKFRARRLGVSGTPTFFINGVKRREVLTLAQLEKLLTK